MRLVTFNLFYDDFETIFLPQFSRHFLAPTFDHTNNVEYKSKHGKAQKKTKKKRIILMACENKTIKKKQNPKGKSRAGKRTERASTKRMNARN